ncbi:alpha/beta fold hydrolase [Noviherbaspirillum cavernae]|uniref:Alpha/beta fold hydrolase n=1 Tax=Noviherbaspirillum cavernae TaxID=2320862 RepID=A0A418X1T8_9BURK|nr:alpha/beta fold hydrolase [Noviherbaspirillum cavernae]RJG06391.1 alpha/beta fold hydrolase [Noviherbaspirillum cavernae]
MIALLAKILLALQFAVACGIGFALMRTGRIDHAFVAVLLGGAIVLLLRLLITANNFFLSWRFRSEMPAAYRLDWRQRCILFFGEFAATMTTSSWLMPFRAFSSRAASHPVTLPLLLVHGYGCNSGYWHPLSKLLLRVGISHRAIDMEPVTGGIDDYVSAIHQAVEILRRESGCSKVIIIAHSMGGLAARAYLRRHGAHHIARIITLGTPHRGTGVAQFGVGLNCKQMHWTSGEDEGVCSEWLCELAASETAASNALFVSIYSHHDNIIAPQTSSYLPGAINIALGGIGHVALGLHPRVQTLIVEEVRKASRVQPAVSVL